MAVMPTPFPRASFTKAKRAAIVFNTLIDRVSRDDSYLQKTLALAAEYDDFTVGFPFASKPSHGSSSGAKAKRATRRVPGKSEWAVTDLVWSAGKAAGDSQKHGEAARRAEGHSNCAGYQQM